MEGWIDKLYQAIEHAEQNIDKTLEEAMKVRR
jgi:hypothetical protein